MSLHVLYFISLLSTALALSGGMAHVFGLPNKINLPANEYVTVQQLYRGWALLGIIVVVALISTVLAAILAYDDKRAFSLTLVAGICILATQLIFWVFTFPVNRKTKNWTILPADWLKLRKQWEYSHAVSAVLDLVALSTLVLSVLNL